MVSILSRPQCVNWTLGDKFHLNLNQNTTIFIKENTFANVACKVAAILSRPRCVEPYAPQCPTLQWHPAPLGTPQPSELSPTQTVQRHWNASRVLRCLLGQQMPNSLIIVCHVSSHSNTVWGQQPNNYRQTSNIRGTASSNLKDSCFDLQLSLPNPLKAGVKSIMKMWLEQRWQAMLQLHLSDQQFYCLRRCILY